MNPAPDVSPALALAQQARHLSQDIAATYVDAGDPALHDQVTRALTALRRDLWALADLAEGRR